MSSPVPKTTIEQAKPVLLSINNYYYRRGGAEAVFFDHNSQFEQLGWQVVPFAMDHPSNASSEWQDYFVKELEYGRQDGLLTKAIQASKVIYSFEARRNLSRLLDRISPSLAHAHNVYHHLSPSFFSLLKARQVPTVMTVHDLKLACPAYKMLQDGKVCEQCKGGALHHVVANRCVKESRILSGLVYVESMVHRMLGLYRDCVDVFVVPSKFYLEKLVEWGWPRERLRYIANAVDVEAMPHDWERQDYFLFAGRLAPEKGLHTLIRASALSSQPLVIAGTGPQEAALRTLVQQLDAPVRFAGYVSGDDLARLIGQAKALVLPSEWYENAPISILEAYGYGTPVIGANIGGIPEMIVDGGTGLIAQSGEAEAWAEAMARLSNLPSIRLNAMGEEGRTLSLERFSKTRYREKMLTLYTELGAPLWR